MSEHKSYQLTHLQQLEAESIYIMREVAAQFGKPALLFSGGKDSIVMVRLAQKAFWPAKLPFPLVHVDTGHNFDETIEFRDRLAKEVGAELVVASVQEEVDAGPSLRAAGLWRRSVSERESGGREANARPLGDFWFGLFLSLSLSLTPTAHQGSLPMVKQSGWPSRLFAGQHTDRDHVFFSLSLSAPDAPSPSPSPSGHRDSGRGGECRRAWEDAR